MEENKRQFKRTKYHVPFTYTADDLPAVASKKKALPIDATGQFLIKKRKGMIQNTSMDGFCFEAETSIQPGTEIRAMASPDPVKLGSKGYNECRATVQWCAKAGIDPDGNYEIGVKRIREDMLPIIDLSKKAFASIKVF